MDKLRALQTFVAVVDHGSLTAAADALGSSLPAVVRTLAALEQQLGTRLIHRTTRRHSLTEEGRAYLERARRIVAEVEEADRLLDQRAPTLRGRISVTAPVLFGQYHIAPVVTEFLLRHPQVEIELVLLDRVVNLVEEGLDVGVRIGALQDSTLVARPSGGMRRVVVASPALLERVGTPAHPRELAALPCLRSHGVEGEHWTFREGGRTLRVRVSGALSTNLAAPMLLACEEGLGFARCLAYQATRALQHKRLRVVLEEFEGEPWPVQVTYASARLLPTRTRVFIEFLHERLKAARW